MPQPANWLIWGNLPFSWNIILLLESCCLLYPVFVVPEPISLAAFDHLVNSLLSPGVEWLYFSKRMHTMNALISSYFQNLLEDAASVHCRGKDHQIHYCSQRQLS